MEATRRNLMVGAAALPAVIVTPLKAEAAESPFELRRRRRREFIEQVSLCHQQRGRYVATYAMAMDLDPDECINIQLRDKTHPERMPQLFWRAPDRPHVTIVVNPLGAFEHGPVF